MIANTHKRACVEPEGKIGSGETKGGSGIR